MTIPSAFELASNRITKLPTETATSMKSIFDFNASREAGISAHHTFRLSSYSVAAGERIAIDVSEVDQILFSLHGTVTVSQHDDAVLVNPWDCIALAAGEPAGLLNSGVAAAQLLLLAADPHVYYEAGRRPVVAGPLAGRRVARWGEVKGYDDAFVTSKTPGLEKRVFKLLNRGISAGQHVVPALSFEFPFTMSIIEMEAGKGATLHSHATEEVFIPLDGALDLFWGDEAEGSLRLGRHEVASMPMGLMRGFRNENGRPLHMLALVGGWNRQSVDSVRYQSEAFPPISKSETALG